jgi:hypothetical protein
MTKDILRSIILHCVSTDLYVAEGEVLVQPLSLWREAIFETFAFLGMARLDDLRNVSTSNVSFSATHMTIFCPKRKNDSLNRGHSLLLKLTNLAFCPKRLYTLYVRRLSASLGAPYTGTLLPFLAKRGKREELMRKPASYPQMRNVQYMVLETLKLDPKAFGCHSGRRGLCKNAKLADRSDSEVQIAGWWSENSTTPQIYDDNNDHAAKHAVADSLAL